MKCQFCERKAIFIARTYKRTLPEEPQGFCTYDCFGEEIFLCGKHTLVVDIYGLDKEEKNAKK